MSRWAAARGPFCALCIACGDASTERVGAAETAPPPPTDSDGDGYTVDDDCDDEAAGVHPGAVEVCEPWGPALDNDCDGLIDDEDPDLDPDSRATWYADADGDGEGSAGSVARACEAPSGFVASDTDCDDSDPAVNTAAAETCESSSPAIDNDCDGLIDEEDDDLTGAPTWYRDEDGDGVGGEDAQVACDAPSDHVATTGDCDDADPEISPLVDEVCSDGVDQDCTGADRSCGPDELLPLVTLPSLRGGAAGDAAGMSLAGAGDTDGDGIAEILVGAPMADSAAGAVYHVAGPLTSSATLSAPIAVGDDAFHYLGWALAGLGDVDGDGLDDVALGSYIADGLAERAGKVQILTAPLEREPGSTLLGSAADDHAGWALAGPGDVNGDGRADLLVGVPEHDGGGEDAGAAVLVLRAPLGEVALESVGETFTGAAPGDGAGRVLAGPGDVDGDGLADLLIGAPSASGLVAGAGATWLVKSATGGSLADADVVIAGTNAGDALGSALTDVGDLDGDGLADLLVAGADRVWLFSAPTDGQIDAADAAAWLWTEREEITLAGPGDVDGDGWRDILVGLPHAGVAAVVRGPLSGTADLGAADLHLSGSVNADVATAVAGPGDLDGDGLGDLLVGVPGDDVGGAEAGAVFWLGGWP